VDQGIDRTSIIVIIVTGTLPAAKVSTQGLAKLGLEGREEVVVVEGVKGPLKRCLLLMKLIGLDCHLDGVYLEAV